MVTNVPVTEHGTPLAPPLAGDRGMVDQRYAETTYTAGRIVHPHWGSIMVGVFVTLATMGLLSVLGVAVGASSYDPYSAGHDARAWGIGAGIWALAQTIIAFIAGGYAASWTSTFNWSKKGTFHGFMVWAVAVPIMGLLLGGGLASLAAGAANANNSGANAMGVRAPDQMNNQINNNANASQDNMTQQDAKKATMATAWWMFISLVLSLGAALLGGMMGAKSPKDVRTQAVGETAPPAATPTRP